MSVQFQQVDVTSHLQRYGLLVGVKVSIPSGVFTPKDGDSVDPNTVAIDRGLKKKAPIVLVPAQHLQPLLKLRSRVSNRMKAVGYPFPIFTSAYFVMIDDIADISKFLTEEIDPEIIAEKRVLAGKWESIRATQIALFNELYPNHRGWLDDKFPEFEEFASTIGVHHTMVNWSPPALAQVTEAELGNYQRQMQDFTASVALEWKKGLIEAVASFKRALTVKSGEVNENSITKFRQFLTKLERHNIFGDGDLSNTINRIRSSVFDDQAWTSDKELRASIAKQLDDVIAEGYSEGEAAAVASKFMRRFTPDSEAVESGDSVEVESVIQRGSVEEESVEADGDQFADDLPVYRGEQVSPIVDTPPLSPIDDMGIQTVRVETVEPEAVPAT